jgi:general secretion pathway protein F
MKTYEYKGFDTKGHASRGLVEGLSIKDARAKLAGKGILAERVVVTGRSHRFPAETRAAVYRELSSLLGAGLPLVRALDMLIESRDVQGIHVMLAGVRDRVKEGSSLAVAFSEASESIGSFERSIIEAAEKSATVEVMLEKLAGFLEQQEQLKSRVQSALIYPSIVVAVAICVAILMLGVLLPRTREMIEESSGSLPALTHFMIGLGTFMTRAIPVAMIVGTAAFFYLRKRLKTDDDFRVRFSVMAFRIPVLGRGRQILVNLRFSRTLSILIQGGVSLIDGLVLAGRATGSFWISRMADVEADAVRHGSSLSDAVGRMGPLSGSLPGLIRVGEASGDLQKLLDKAATRYEDQWERYASRCLGFVEPIVIVVIGVFVLLVALSVLLPIIKLSMSIGGA